MDKQVLLAFSLTLIAGLSTGIGSAIAFFAKRTNFSFLCLSLGFSAGVMIYVSFVELFPQSLQYFTKTGITPKWADLYAALSFFGGVALIALIDKLVPSAENPHEMRNPQSIHDYAKSQPLPVGGSKRRRGLLHGADRKIFRVGLITALVLFIHNFPEGMVTFLSGLEELQLAIPITVAIAIHNIPEGISVSVPIYYATGNKRFAFWISFFSGLAEPVGGLLGYLVLAPFLNDTVCGVIFAFIAGIMVFISLDELLPAAEKYGKHHLAIYGLIAGMLVMAASLILL